MFNKFLSRLVGQAANPDLLRTKDPDQWESALLERIKERLPGDPLIGAKIGGKELAARLVDAMKKNQGVHVESLMCAAEALAGYACQAAVRAANRASGRNEPAGLAVAETGSGQNHLFGDPLNQL